METKKKCQYRDNSKKVADINCSADAIINDHEKMSKIITSFHASFLRVALIIIVNILNNALISNRKSVRASDPSVFTDPIHKGTKHIFLRKDLRFNLRLTKLGTNKFKIG